MNCWDKGAGGYLLGDRIDCMKNGWSATKRFAGTHLGPRDSSVNYRRYYDVDGFRVHKGCRVWGEWGHGRPSSFDRHGSSTSMWVRITGTTSVVIRGSRC